MARTCQYCGTATHPGATFCTNCGERVARRTEWHATIPQRLQEALGPKFTVIGELGRGGFAVVYSVRDTKRGHYLAVKVMRPDLMPSKRMMERFRREAQFISQLDHPNILPVLFTGKDQGLVYYAMPRVRGPTLRERLDTDGALPVEDVRRIGAAIASGLAHAHERNVIHRDVKPANIMLEDGHNVRILDFGIAKALSAEGGTLSVTGEIIGSAEYMSPEQATGSRTMDRRSDIYSLGVVLFEMVTGKPPYRGANFHDIMVQHVADPVPDPREVRPDAPETIAGAIMRALAKEPDARWADAHELADHLAS